MHEVVKLLLSALDRIGDQLIDLVITIVVVDRILAWREQRRWKNVRGLIQLQFEAGLGDFLRSWSRWLAALRARGTPLVASEIALSAFAKMEMPAHPTLPPEDLEEVLRQCAGPLIPDPAESSFLDSVDPAIFRKQLFGQLVSVGLDSQDIAWPTLLKDLQTLVPRLAAILERIPENATSIDTLGCRQFVEGLYLLTRKIDPTLDQTQAFDDEGSVVDRAGTIAYTLQGAILLMRVFRTHSRADH